MSLKRDESGLRMAEPFRIPLPKSTQGILDVLRRVLSKPYVLSISLRAGSPIEVEWERSISEHLDINDLTEESAESILTRIELEEFDSTSPARSALLEAVLTANLQGLHATHLFVGSVQATKDWLDIPRVVQLPKFEGTDYLNLFGLKLLEVPSIPEDTVVLMAAEVLNANRSELVKGYRITA
jgi:hypothetical protein